MKSDHIRKASGPRDNPDCTYGRARAPRGDLIRRASVVIRDDDMFVLQSHYGSMEVWRRDPGKGQWYSNVSDRRATDSELAYFDHEFMSN